MESLNEGKEGFVRWFSDISRASSSDLGQKGRSLFELNNLGFNVPACFVISSKFYDFFVERLGLSEKIDFILNSIDFKDFKNVEDNSLKIRELFLNSEFPKEVEKEILEAYDILNYGDSKFETLSPLEALSVSGEPAFVAVRSSLVFEDIIEDDFSCQQDSYFNVKGKQELITTIKKCLSSLFTSRAVYYRNKRNLDHKSFSLAVVVQRMVDSDKSGVVYSNYSKEGDFFVESSFGLGEGIASGQVTPDRYIVSREMEIKSKEISNKGLAFTRDSSGSLKLVKLREEVSNRQTLSDYELARVCELTYDIEKNFGYPVEVEFAIESRDIFILQFKQFEREIYGKVENFSEGLLNGVGGFPKVVSGNIRLIKELSDLEKISSSDILVINSLFSELILPLQSARGVISKNGGFSSCLSVFCRQNKIPYVSGIAEDINLLNEGERVSLDCSSGKVFRGNLEGVSDEEADSEKFVEKDFDTKEIFAKTKFRFILDSEESNKACRKFSSSRGAIIRFEKDFSSCGKHPLFFEKSGNYSEYSSRVFDSINRLSSDLNEVWISFSDFRDNSLEGVDHRKLEENPILGNHGIRFLKSHPEIFKAEVMAIKKFSNSFSGSLGVVIPFVSNISEINFVKDFLVREGLENVRIGVFLQTPASVQIIKEIKEANVDLVVLDVEEFSQGVLMMNLKGVSSSFYLEEGSVLRQIEYLLRFCRREKLEVYSYLDEVNSLFNRFLVEKEISGVVVSPSKYFSFFKEFSLIEEEVFKNTDKEPRLYELKKQEEVF